MGGRHMIMTASFAGFGQYRPWRAAYGAGGRFGNSRPCADSCFFHADFY